MNILLNKIQQAHTELVNEKGDFSLFACVELAINENEWDIIVCADWLPERKRAAIDVIVDKLEQILGEDDFLNISRVIVLNKDDPFYCELKKISKDIKENVHKNFTIAGLDVKEINVLQMQSSEDAKFDIREDETSYEDILSSYIEKIVRKTLEEMLLSSKNISDVEHSQLDEYKTKSKQSNLIDFQEQKIKRMAA